MNITVREATIADVNLVTKLAHLLLAEITPLKKTPPTEEEIYEVAKDLIGVNASVWAFIATCDGDEAIGLLTLNECAAIYAGGRFGEISEFYVTPGGRSKGIGAKLLDAAREFGILRNWKRLEVGAPDVPRWERTVKFYLNNGFEEVGTRLRMLL